MSAGFAAADVSVSGDGRMGIVSTDGSSAFWNRMRIKFSGSGTTDAGLSFGGSFRAGEAGDADENQSSKGSVFISGAFGKITMGSVDSGDAASVGQLASVGFTGLGSGNSISYAADGGILGLTDTTNTVATVTEKTAGGSARVLYTYSANGLTVNASTAQLSDTETPSFGIGGSYTTGALTFAVGYGSTGSKIAGLNTTNLSTANNFDAEITDTSVSATYVMGTTTIKGIYQQKSLTLDETTAGGETYDLAANSMGLSVVHVIDAISLTAYTVTTEIDLGDLSDDGPSVARSGVGVSYNLGGGASITAGWANVGATVFTEATASANTASAPTLTTESTSMYDIGMNFSF